MCKVQCADIGVDMVQYMYVYTYIIELYLFCYFFVLLCLHASSKWEAH